MSLDISEIVSDFGAVYENNGQNQDRIIRQLRKPLAFEELMTPITTTETNYKAATSVATEVLQGYQKAWTPKGDVALKPVEHILRKAKADIEIEPHDVSFSWAGFLEGQSDVDVKNWPVARFMMEQEFIPQLRQDLELKALFHGEYVAPTPGTPGAAIETMDGLNKQRKNAQAAGRLGTITMGAIPASDVDFVAYVKDFCKQIASQYRNGNMTLAMSPDLFLKYKDGYLEKYGANFSVNALQNTKVTNLSINVAGYEAMEGSDVIFVTPKKNLVSIKKAKSNEDNWKIESLKREIFAFTHFYRAVGINYPEIFFTNDLELV